MKPKNSGPLWRSSALTSDEDRSKTSKFLYKFTLLTPCEGLVRSLRKRVSFPNLAVQYTVQPHNMLRLLQTTVHTALQLGANTTLHTPA